jgi:hypothetical protein
MHVRHTWCLWMVVVGAVLGGGGPVSAGASKPMPPGEFASPEGRFKAAFPQAPRESAQRTAGGDAKIFSGHGRRPGVRAFVY